MWVFCGVCCGILFCFVLLFKRKKEYEVEWIERDIWELGWGKYDQNISHEKNK